MNIDVMGIRMILMNYVAGYVVSYVVEYLYDKDSQLVMGNVII